MMLLHVPDLPVSSSQVAVAFAVAQFVVFGMDYTYAVWCIQLACQLIIQFASSSSCSICSSYIYISCPKLTDKLHTAVCMANCISCQRELLALIV